MQTIRHISKGISSCGRDQASSRKKGGDHSKSRRAGGGEIISHKLPRGAISWKGGGGVKKGGGSITEAHEKSPTHV